MSLLYEAFRKGTGPMTVYKNYKRAHFLSAGAQAAVMQRDLVQWNLTQMREHNIETSGAYLEPLLALRKGMGSWNSMVSGMSAEEVADMEAAKGNLEHYQTIYEIFEYCEELNHTMNILQTRMAGLNPTLAMNMYRASSASSVEKLWPEFEKCLEAYYVFYDDFEGHAEW